MKKPNKISIRPTIDSLIASASWSNEEQFQNNTLRPIIKLQHDLLIAFFDHYLNTNKISFEQLPATEKRMIINNRFKQDHRLKLELRGLIVGHFTVEEFNQYRTMAAAMNKRIITIIAERLISLI